MRAVLRVVLLLAFTQILCLPVAADEPVPLTPVPPSKDDLKIDITKVCKVPEYPREAVRFGMQGKTVLKLSIDETGKISAFQLLRSSGWKMLDIMVMQAISGCQVIPPGHWMPSERPIAYLWKLDQNYTNTAELDPNSCKPSETLRIANDKDQEVGIVVGIYASDTGKVLDAKVQWGSDDAQLDQESLRIARSCEFMPAEYRGKRVGMAGSIRFVAKAE